MEVSRSRRRGRIVIICIAILAALFGIAASVHWLRPSVDRNDLVIATVGRGSVDATVEASGLVVPEVEHVVSTPLEARVLRIDRHPGDRVRKGDEILTLDTSEARLELEQLDEKIAEKENEQTQIGVKLEETLASSRSQLEQAKLDARIFDLKAQQARRLRAEGLVAEQEDLAAATAAEKSAIQLHELSDGLVRSQRTGDAQIAAAGIELSILRKQREESRRQLELAMTRSDRDGVVTWVVADEGVTVQRGDIVARIADLSAFRVAATVADVHITQLSVGMPVRVKLGEGVYAGGAISTIEPRIDNGVAKFYVELDQKSHPALRNNLRVDVFVIVGRRKNVLRLQRGALGQGENGGVFVVRGDHAVRVPVRFGLFGEDRVEVVDGLKVGNQVVISNMSDYQDVKQLRIK